MVVPGGGQVPVPCSIPPPVSLPARHPSGLIANTFRTTYLNHAPATEPTGQGGASVIFAGSERRRQRGVFPWPMVECKKFRSPVHSIRVRG